jgi:hypothetical protein
MAEAAGGATDVAEGTVFHGLSITDSWPGFQQRAVFEVKRAIVIYLSLSGAPLRGMKIVAGGSMLNFFE